MRLVILGPPGSGKGTQAKRLAAQTGAAHISPGELVRAEIGKDSPLGRTIKDYNDRGELVPDNLILQLVAPVLATESSWILDGFPRDREQASLLDRMLAGARVKLDRVIALEVPDEVLIARLTNRRQSQSTGKTFNLATDPPPAETFGDKDSRRQG